MPNKPVQAAGEAIPSPAPDPLLEAIRLYKRGLAEFNFRTFDVDDDAWDDLVPLTYGPHLDTLNEWDQPALSVESAMEALRIALKDDGGVQGCPAERQMVLAAYGFLKGITA